MEYIWLTEGKQDKPEEPEIEEGWTSWIWKAFASMNPWRRRSAVASDDASDKSV